MSTINLVTDRVRVLVHGLLSSDRGDALKPVKIAREWAGIANDFVGRPFCSADEITSRRGIVAVEKKQGNEAAPVVVYFDGKDHRTLKKLEEVLRGRSVPYRVLDVADDEATRSWALTQAKAHEFPLLFIAGDPVGGLHEVTALDVNRGLEKRVFSS